MSFHADAFRRPSINCEPIYSWIWDAPADETGVRNRMYKCNTVFGIIYHSEPKISTPNDNHHALNKSKISCILMRVSILREVRYSVAVDKGLAFWSVCTK